MAEQEYVSLLNLKDDTEELLNYNPEADANASIPPFPAGTYPCIVTFASEDVEKIWGVGVAKDGQKFLKTSVKLELYGTPEGAYDGRSITHYVNTYTSKFSGTNSVQALLQGLGKGEEIRTVKARGALAEHLNDALMGGNATVEGVFDWEARYSIEEVPDSGIFIEKFKKVGMTRFKKLDDGSYDPIADYNGVAVMARDVLVRFVNPDKVQGTGSAQSTAQAPRPVSAPPRPAASMQAPQPVQPVQQPTLAQTAPQAAQQGPPVPPRVRQGPPRAAGAPVPVGQR